MEEGSVAKTIFSERVKQLNQPGTPIKDEEYSIVSNLMDVVTIFNLSREVLNMIERGHVYEKTAWKKIIWDRAWSLEDTFWRGECNLQRNLDLISVINPNPRYLTWWALSDRYPSLIYFCETLGRLVCHASLFEWMISGLKGYQPLQEPALCVTRPLVMIYIYIYTFICCKYSVYKVAHICPLVFHRCISQTINYINTKTKYKKNPGNLETSLRGSLPSYFP